jgi:PAS domain S-box-containing protein
MRLAVGRNRLERNASPSAVIRPALTALAVLFSGLSWPLLNNLQNVSHFADAEFLVSIDPWVDGALVVAAAALVFCLTRIQVKQVKASQSLADASRAQIEATFDTASAGIAIISIEGKFVRVNDKFCKMLGRPEAALLGESPDDFACGRESGHEAALIEQAIAGHISSFDVEQCLTAADGTDLWINKSMSLVRLTGGTPDYFVAVAIDTTAQKTTENTLQASDERFQLAMLGANDGLWDWNLTTGEVYYSPRSKSMLGYEPDELSNNRDDWKALVHPDDLPGCATKVKEWLEGSSPNYECHHRFRHKAGHYVDILSRGHCVRDASGNAIRAVGTHLDVTERKATEAALREVAEMNGFLAKISASLPGALVTYRQGPGGTCQRVYASENFAGLYGISSSDKLESLSALLEAVNASDREHLESSLCDAEQTQSRWRHEYRISHPTRGMVWIEETSAPSPQSDGTTLWHGFVHDITERKMADEDAKRWHRMFEATNFELAQSDAKTGKFIAVNREFAVQRGYEPHELLGQSVHVIYPAELHAEIDARLKQIDELGYFVFETIHKRKDGSLLPVLADLTVLRDASGVPISRIAHCIDISKFRSTNSALWQGEVFAHPAVASLQSGLAVFGKNGCLISCNPAAERIMRMTQAEVNERTSIMSDFIAIRENGSRIENDERPVALAFSTGKLQEAQVIGVTRIDESVAWLLLKAEPIQDPVTKDVNCVICSFTDITDQKLAEGAQRHLSDSLKKSELDARLQKSRFESIFDSAPDGILLVDQWRRFSMVNPGFCRIFGFDNDEIIGTETRRLYASEEDWQRVGLEIRRAMTGEATSQQTYSFVRKSGEIFRGHANGAPLKNESGEIIGYVGIVRDITTDEVRDKALEASKRLEAIGRLTSGVAHDFNNLLTVISGNLQLLKMTPLAANQERRIATAENAAEMGSRLNQRLMTFAQTRQLTPQLVDLNDVIKGMMQLLKSSLGDAHAIQTQFLLAPDLPRVHIDPSEMENVVLNLAINARDAMPTGGTLTVRTVMGSATSDTNDRASPVGGQTLVRLQVTDTGTGMTPETLSRAFEPFFTTKDSGTGLGLATVHGFVKQSGGRILVESEVGLGTTISIELPALEPAGKANAIAGETTGPTGIEKPKILVVEDNADVRTTVVDGLSTLGFRVLQAGNGNDALRLVLAHDDIDLVFSDVVMPGGMSGPQLAEQVLRVRPDTKIILTSGNTNKIEAGHLRGPLMLAKPFAFSELANAIETSLAKKSR